MIRTQHGLYMHYGGCCILKVKIEQKNFALRHIHDVAGSIVFVDDGQVVDQKSDHDLQLRLFSGTC